MLLEFDLAFHIDARNPRKLTDLHLVVEDQ